MDQIQYLNRIIQLLNYSNMENKLQSKNATERIQRNGSKSKTVMKFERITKQNVFGAEQKQKKRLHDAETMKQIIQGLKEENGQYKQVIKIQQTQLYYFREQQKNIANGIVNEDDRQKLLKKNIFLRHKIQKLIEECEKIKKSCKFSKVKQLQISNQQYLEQIKILTAKLKSSVNQKSSVNELNQMIEKQYFTSLKNKQLEKKLAEKEMLLQKSEKYILKLKNMNNAKNRELQQIKQNYEQLTKQTKKIRNFQDYVHKSEFIAKKKQLLAMSQTIENLEIKLLQCQNKAQALQQENIDNMNREAAKKKEMIAAYQAVKQKCSQLESLLLKNSQLNESNIQNMRLNKSSTQGQLLNKQKIPFFVSSNDLQETVREIVFKLQEKNIQKDQGIDLLLGYNQQCSQNILSDSPEQPRDQQHISIHQLICTLDSAPFCIEQYEQKQLFARYCTEDACQDNQYIQFNNQVNIEYVRSILKQLIPNYVLYTFDEKVQFCSQIEKVRLDQYIQYLMDHQYSLKQTLKPFQSDRKIQMSVSGAFDSHKKVYQCQSIINCIKKQRQLEQRTICFIDFYVFNLRKTTLSFEQFIQAFKIEDQGHNKEGQNQGFCVFLTQRDREQQDLQPNKELKSQSQQLQNQQLA